MTHITNSGDPHSRTTPRPARPSGGLDLARYPNVYDAAFSWDRRQEARTYLRVATARIGRAPRAVAELACGSGPLARLWASWGFETYGADRSAPALAQARAARQAVVPSGHWILGDLRSFRFPRRVEMAVVPMDSLGYLLEERDFLAFFQAARRCLAPRGVLLVDLTLHPENGPPLPIENGWKVSLRPHGSLRVRWRSQGKPWGSPPRQWEVGRITVQVPGRSRQVFWEACPHSALSARTIRDLARQAGGFGEMQVYSNAAHRPRGARMRQLARRTRAQGPRLLCWQRE